MPEMTTLPLLNSDLSSDSDGGSSLCSNKEDRETDRLLRSFELKSDQDEPSIPSSTQVSEILLLTSYSIRR